MFALVLPGCNICKNCSKYPACVEMCASVRDGYCFTDTPMLERLARLETQFESASGKSEDGEGGEKKKTEDGEPEDDEPIEEDEDDFQEDDDYYQVSTAITK